MPQPFAWWNIVCRSTVLSGDQKVVWDLVRQLDSPKTGDGCWLTTEQLALRTGLRPRSVETILQDLVRDQLLVVERRGKRYHKWVRLPEPCYPSERPTEAELVRYAQLLDALIQRHPATAAAVPSPHQEVRR